MRIGAILAPVADWNQVLEAAIAADELDLDAIGLWDHYHSAKPEWAYVAGWSAHAALAQATSQVRIVPAVINTLHYELGVLAKESALLSLISDGRFELAVGAGDWPASFEAWGRPFPSRAERVARFVETLAALRMLWGGDSVTFEGRFHQLRHAASTPVPDTPPRIVVGIGKSLTLARASLDIADELNVYADEAVLMQTLELVAGSPRTIDVSMFFSWEWDKWPADPAGELQKWQTLGVERCLVSLGSTDMVMRLQQLADVH
jgi:alkanesulfonate monooxygenase SsuD/methylene tetrahydromethanopterin reductase-like flavin-dependent oxidoreductase (luciferase family)